MHDSRGLSVEVRFRIDKPVEAVPARKAWLDFGSDCWPARFIVGAIYLPAPRHDRVTPNHPYKEFMPDEYSIDNPDDDVIPASPGRRRLAIIAAVIILLVVIVFLVWFTAENTEQSNSGGSLLGNSVLVEVPVV